MFISRKNSVAIYGLLMMLSSGVPFVAGTEPHLRTHQEPEHEPEPATPQDVDISPKFEFTMEKGVKCKGSTDPKKEGGGKKCEAGMKKKISVGLGAEEIASDAASEMEGLYKMLMPDQDSLLPMDETMLELMEMDDIDVEEMEKGASKTVEFGGFLKAFWGCNVTYSKDSLFKVSETIQCGAKAMQGMGKVPQDEEILDVADVSEEENEF
mmetsp:Transcript_6674/g.10423  ORF Transcript_6674/g.10423 Transcript_6674/m.10423 type:complete len:210 (-) Transcript_6674:508-1137(-)